MKQPLVVVAVLLLSLGIASASFIPCTITGTGIGGSVNSGTVIGCGPVTFEGFQVLNATGGASGIVDVLSGTSYNTATGTAYLQFDPNVQASQDEQLLFEVEGGISQIDLAVGGVNATVTESACANPIATSGALADLCTNAAGTMSEPPLGQIAVTSNTPGQPVLSSAFPTTSPVYIFKDIQTGPGGALSEFTQSFEGPNAIPEPVSSVLLGAGLVGLALLRRRSTKS